MIWAATGKLGTVLKKQIPINLKRKVFNMCNLSVLTYGMETTPHHQISQKIENHLTCNKTRYARNEVKGAHPK